jgi:tetratricopeptide (TPR) repeat protein
MAFRRRRDFTPELDDALAREAYSEVETLAVEALSQARPNSLEASEILTRYGIALQRMSRYEQAERALSQAANIRTGQHLNDEITYNALLYLGHTLRRLHDADEAVISYHEAIDLIAPYRGHDWPRLLEAWVPLARTLAEIGHGDQARKAAQRSVEITERTHGRESSEAVQAREFLEEIEAALAESRPPEAQAAEALVGQERSVSTTPLPRTDPNPALVDDILAELDRMIGLGSVKQQARSLVNFIRVQQARQAAGAKPIPRTYHMIFTGNPGTGKTTVARQIARIFNALGILATDKLTEGDRSSLGISVNQPARRILLLIKRSMAASSSTRPMRSPERAKKISAMKPLPRCCCEWKTIVTASW